MDETPMPYVKWKKPGSNCYIPYDSTYVIFWKRPNYNDRKQISGCQELWDGDRGWPQKGQQEGHLKGDGTILYIDSVGGLSTLIDLTWQRWLLLYINYTSDFKKEKGRVGESKGSKL